MGILITALALALGSAACHPPLPPGARTSPAASSARPSANPPSATANPAPLTLTRFTFLGTSFLAPTGWSRRQTVHGPADGFVTFSAPSGEYSVYVEVNNCAACVDQGLVNQGVANGVPDPDKVLSQQGAISVTRLSDTRVEFTSRLFGAGPLLHSLLAIVTTPDTVTGYVLLQVSLPATVPATNGQQMTGQVLASLTVPATLGMGS